MFSGHGELTRACSATAAVEAHVGPLTTLNQAEPCLRAFQVHISAQETRDCARGLAHFDKDFVAQIWRSFN